VPLPENATTRICNQLIFRLQTTCSAYYNPESVHGELIAENMKRIMVLILMMASTLAHPQSGDDNSVLLPVQRNGLYGYILHSGAEAISVRFDQATRFSEGLAAVRMKDDCGYIDATGAFRIPPRFESARSFSEGRAVVSVADSGNIKYFFVDKTGILIGGKGYENAGPFSEGFAPAQEHGNWFYVDESGKQAFGEESLFDTADCFAEGLAHVSKDGHHGFIDRTGGWSIAARFRSAKSFSDGLAAVQGNDGLWGYVDHEGSVRIPAQFESAGQFSAGLAPVRLSGEAREKGFGYIDKDGNLAIEPRFGAAHSFAEQLALVSITDPYASDSADLDGTVADPKRWGYIDLRGEMVIPPHFVQAEDFHDGVASVITAIFGRALYINREDLVVAYASNRPALGSAGIVNSTISIQLVLDSTPPGAEVFLIPRFEWETHPQLEEEIEKWWQYRVPEGVTPVTTRATRSAYLILFRSKDTEAKDKPPKYLLKKVLKVVREGEPNNVKVTIP
jgi:hypothetical protein